MLLQTTAKKNQFIKTLKQKKGNKKTLNTVLLVLVVSITCSPPISSQHIRHGKVKSEIPYSDDKNEAKSKDAKWDAHT